MSQHPLKTHHQLLERLLVAILGAIALHGLFVLLLSLTGALSWCWASALLILLGFSYHAFRCWQTADQAARDDFKSAWSWPLPWLIVALVLAQIALYPPMMADSLCYRLPRIFIALQHGGIDRFETPDYRMNSMPWGWETMALPFASLNAINWSKLVNLAAWLVSYHLLFSWARSATSSLSKARWIALGLASAPVFLLQSASTANDLYAGILLLSGVWMIRNFHASPCRLPVMASLLALILAANVKPQFLVLGLPWLAWWMFAQGAPWRCVSWKILAIAFPFYLLLSPLPLLAENLMVGGSLMGEDEANSFTTHAPAWKLLIAGFVQFAGSQLQLPVLPGADSMTAFLRSIPGVNSLHRAIPKFNPGVQLIPIVDSASYGLLHFSLIVVGLVQALRIAARREKYWIAAALLGFVVAASQVVPSTIARSFMGFVILLLPAAAIGLATIKKHRFITMACGVAMLGGLAALLLNPSAPMWPSRQLQNLADKKGNRSIATKLEKYHAYQKRSETGNGILHGVPYGATVGLLSRQVTPIVALWQPDWRAHHIRFVEAMDPAEFNSSPVNWLIVTENSAQEYATAHQAYTHLQGWGKVLDRNYLPTISQGSETWILYRRSETSD